MGVPFESFASNTLVPCSSYTAYSRLRVMPHQASMCRVGDLIGDLKDESTGFEGDG